MAVLSPSGWPGYWAAVADRDLFAVQAADHVRRLRRHIPLRPCDRVLDFGCGFGHVVERLAPHVARIEFWDAAEGMRRATERRTAHLATVGAADLDTDVPPPSPGGYDLILVNSVIQYMAPAELAEWLVRWSALLQPSGVIVLSDVPAPGSSPVRELASMLRFAARHGILVRTAWDLTREATHYLSLLRSSELQRWEPAQLARTVTRCGLVADRLPSSLTHFQGRFALLLRPAG